MIKKFVDTVATSLRTKRFYQSSRFLTKDLALALCSSKLVTITYVFGFSCKMKSLKRLSSVKKS